MTPTQSLIAKLSDATEGSREMSDAVLLATGWTRRKFGALNCWAHPDGSECFNRDRPDPTRDLTAAVSLIPEGWGWRIQNYGGDKIGLAALMKPGTHIADYEQGATPELALTIAALRAREVNTDDL